MENKKMTAVEWLIEQVQNINLEIVYTDKIHSVQIPMSVIEQTKQLEKQQIMEAYMKAKLENIDTLGLDVVKNKIINDTEQYYNETYGK